MGIYIKIIKNIIYRGFGVGGFWVLGLLFHFFIYSIFIIIIFSRIFNFIKYSLLFGVLGFFCGGFY